MEMEPELKDLTPQTVTGQKKPGLISGAKYLREISVVVIGVAITLLASAWITAHREKKMLGSHLEAVRIELEDNHEYLSERRVFYRTLIQFGWFLNEMPQNSHHPDTVWKRSLFYDDGNIQKSVLEYSSYLNIEKSAFETLKASGSMNLLKNQRLMRELQKCYNRLDEAKQDIDRSTEKKRETIDNAFISGRIFTEARINEIILDPRMEEVFIYFSRPYMTDQLIDASINQIEKTLLMF